MRKNNENREKEERIHFNSMAELYDAKYGYNNEFTQYKIVKKINKTVKAINENLHTKKHNILEIGCGTGVYTKFLARKLPESKITGLDISKNMITLARKKCRRLKNVNFICKSFYESGLQKEKFDVVIGFYTLHHLNIEKTAKEIFRILKDGGLSLFYEPNILNPLVFLIKTNKFLKMRSGDSKDEGAINPLTIEKYFINFKKIEISTSEFVLPIKRIAPKTLELIDKRISFVNKIPTINLFGGSTRIFLKKESPLNNVSLKTYDWLYKNEKFRDISIPDYKITDNRKIRNNKILVLGVGSARDLKHLIKNNEVWGIDSSATSIKYCKELGIKTLKKNLSTNKLLLKKSYFDIVIVKDILEHVDKPMKLILNIKSFLRRDGYMVISVPNHFFLYFRLRILFGSNLLWKTLGHDHTKLFEEWNYMHKTYFTWKGFRKFIEYSNLKIVKTFWDFGTLAHYDQPEIVISYFDQISTGKFKKVIIGLLKFFWSFFNIVFPRKIRSAIVSLNPGLFSAGFYVWCKKKDQQKLEI